MLLAGAVGYFSGCEVVDALVERRHQRRKTLALDERRILRAPQREFTDGSVQQDVDDSPTPILGRSQSVVELYGLAVL